MDRREAIAGSSTSRQGPLTRGTTTNPHQTTTSIPPPVRNAAESTSRATRASASSASVATKKGKASTLKEREASRKKASVVSVKATAEATDTKSNIQAEQLLNALKGDWESIRSLVTCKICYGLMYEPFTSSCGHTYCYNCFYKSWPLTNAKKSCPECRTVLLHAPAPAFLIRDLTNILVKRTELLPEDETIEQHAETQKEQSDLVQKDKTSTKGLFKGLFGRPRVPGRSMSSADQCPMCLMELDHSMGRCPQCGMRPVDYFDAYEDDDDYVEEDDFSYAAFSDPSSMTEDPDFDDIDDGFDGVAATHYLEYADDDEMEFEDMSTISGLSTWANASAVHRYVQDTYHPGANRRSASHSASASRRHSASVISDYAETEMAVVEEEDEDDMEDGDSSMSGMTEEEDATTGAEDSEQTMHSARSTPSSQGTGASSASSTSRRRPRADSNTPTPSMSQPSQRRRLSPPRQSTPYYAMESEDSWVDEPDGEEDSDEEGTTIGCEPTINSNNGERGGGSLTLTADQNNQGPSRSRTSVGRSVRSAPLRNRGSAIQMNASLYDDHDADDDAEGSSMQSLTQAARTRQVTVDHDSDEGGVELESPEQASRHSISRRNNTSMRGVNERVRQAFSNHVAVAVEDHQMGMPNLDVLRELNRTPLARPRPTSRNGGMVILNQARHEGVARLHYNVNANGNLSTGPVPIGSSINFSSYGDGHDPHRPPSSNARRTPLGHPAFGGPTVPPPSRTTYGNPTNNPYWNGGNGPTRSLRSPGSNATLRASTSSQRLRAVGSRGSVRSPQTSPSQPRRVLNNPPVEHHQPRPLNHTPSRMHLLPGSNAAPRGTTYGMAPETSVPLGAFTPTARESLSRNGDRFVETEARIRQRMRELPELQHLNQRRTSQHHQQQLSQGSQLLSRASSNLDSPGISIARPSANPFTSTRTVSGSGFSMPPPPPSAHHSAAVGAAASALNHGSGASGSNTGGFGSSVSTATHGAFPHTTGPGRRRSHQRLSTGSNLAQSMGVNGSPSLNLQGPNSPRTRGQLGGRGGSSSHMTAFNGRGSFGRAFDHGGDI